MSGSPRFHPTLVQLQAIEAATFGYGVERAANLATAYIGVREIGTNRGPVVRHFAGCEGKPWCGAFAHYIAERAFPGVYTQENFMQAQSYQEEAIRNHAFRRPGTMPNIGDMVVFDRGKNGQAHVGVVTQVNPDGGVVYVAGNDGGAVTAHTYNGNYPPRELRGHADTAAIARHKGIVIDVAGPSSPQPPLQVMNVRRDIPRS